MEQHLLSTNEWDTVWAKPQRKDPRGTSVPGQFDSVMIHTGSRHELYLQSKSDFFLTFVLASYSLVLLLLDHEVAQLRVIFRIPIKYLRGLFKGKHPIPRYLVYIERFEPFNLRVQKGAHGLYQVKRSVGNDGAHLASIVPLGHIQRSVHLFPAFGQKPPGQLWTRANVLDLCTTFYLNSFSDRHAYHWFA